MRGGKQGAVLQIALVAGVVLLLAIIASNTAANLSRLGVRTGLEFLARPAGFDISQAIIPFEPSATYLMAFVVALLNTLLVTALSIVLASLLGLALGLARLSSNGLVSASAGIYVETIRNVPLLLQLLFWYFAILQPLPGPRGSLSVAGLVFLNNRGLVLPSLHLGEGGGAVVVAGLIGIAASIALTVVARRRREATGRSAPWRWLIVLPVLALPLAVGLVSGAEIGWSVPHLAGFNFRGGVTIAPELFALTLGLSIYSAAFIAEIVRGGLQSIARGQIEAGRALGLTRWQIARLVEIPIALRAIVPPLGAYCIILLKNSSLGAAIAYPDLMHVFAGTVLNQTGQPVEVMLITLATYLFLGLGFAGLTNAINRWLRT
jgi:general L-amino acid transport system permease protein